MVGVFLLGLSFKVLSDRWFARGCKNKFHFVHTLSTIAILDGSQCQLLGLRSAYPPIGYGNAFV